MIFKENMSYEDIAKKYGYSSSYIRTVAKQLGFKLPNRHSPLKGMKRQCRNCGKELPSKARGNTIYCCMKCQHDYEYKTYITEWKKGNVLGVSGKSNALSSAVRRYMFTKYDNKCQLCGWSSVNEYTGLIPLQVHHIDGDSKNNREENLQLLCPNCHSLTENFGSRNKNCSRAKR